MSATATAEITYAGDGVRLQALQQGSGPHCCALDRLLTLTRGQNTFSYAYDPAGNVTRRTYPGGVISDYAYDPLNRLTTVTSGGQTTSYATTSPERPRRQADRGRKHEGRDAPRALPIDSRDRTPFVGPLVMRVVLSGSSPCRRVGGGGLPVEASVWSAVVVGVSPFFNDGLRRDPRRWHEDPAGIWEGASENAAVCRRALADLGERGLTAEQGLLVCIDGSKALRTAVTEALGQKAAIQRCRRHKEQNVLGHLPEAERPWVKRKLREAWTQDRAELAERRLAELARALDEKRPGAAASLREGLHETLTVTRLGVRADSTLGRTLATTNPIESMLSICRERARNVKRWRGGKMALRWTAAGMLAAERSFRRVKGFRDLAALQAALRRHAAHVDRKEVEDFATAA